MSYDPVVLGARAVQQARTPQRCADCGRSIVGAHITAYVVHLYDRPVGLRFHGPCITPAHEQDLKVAAAMVAWRSLIKES